MGMNVFAGKASNLRWMTRDALVSGGDHDAVEHGGFARFKRDDKSGLFKFYGFDTASETEVRRQSEMIGIALEIAAHFGMVGIKRRIIGEREIDEAADFGF